MAESRDNIKDIFSAKLKDLEVDVPTGLWAEIEKDLPAKKIVFLSKRFLLKVGSIAASFAVVAAMSVYVYDTALSDEKEDDPVNVPMSKIPPLVKVKDTVPEIAEAAKIVIKVFSGKFILLLR